MITDTQKTQVLQYYNDVGILKKEIRSYEVSLWTLQDEFITVLKWSDVEQQGRIENAKMTLNIDGTEDFEFSVPMYYNVNGNLVENPNWYTINNMYVVTNELEDHTGRLFTSLRKVKVIFNKKTEDEEVFEFVIVDVQDSHDSDVLTCEVTCKGLAFQELGKIGYKINLSQANFELIYEEWQKNGSWHKKDGTEIFSEPIQNINYWCEEAGLIPLPDSESEIRSRVWYYEICMNWASFEDGSTVNRASDIVYEEAFTSSWADSLTPLAVEAYREKARAVEASNSNLYNITQSIAEKFGVFCRYHYLYDNNYHIIGKIITFYNNFFYENETPVTFQYPYSSKSIKRKMESEDTVTKLFVMDTDNPGIMSGYSSIMDAPPNPTQEDYILNFDYLYKIHTISKEQYDAIKPYEQAMRQYNKSLQELQLKRDTYELQIPEYEAKAIIAERSVDLDKEQILQNNELRNALDVLDSELDGYIQLTSANPDQLVILKREDGTLYLNLANTNKGIKEDSIQIYKTISFSTNGASLSNLITSFRCDHDEYGNLTTISLLAPSELLSSGVQVTKLYLLYKYDPQLYYDNIITMWQVKLFKDTQQLNEYRRKLGPTSLTDTTFNLDCYPTATTLEQAFNKGIYKLLDDVRAEIEAITVEKNAAIKAFERLMGPALREGYWQPQDYNDYGDHQSFTGAITTDDITADSGKTAIAAWDSKLFDEEDTLYYEFGINQTIKYYPCIDLSAVFPNGIPTDLNEYSLVWKATSLQGYSYDWDSIKDLQMFSVGSQALIKFIRYQGNIKPVLVIVGAKTLTDDQLARLTSDLGSPRLEKYNISINGAAITITHSDIKNVSGFNWIRIADDTDISSVPIVYPRIKFSSQLLKTDTDSLTIKYNDQLLTAFENYYINIRNTERDNNYYPEYYITIKPEVLIKLGLNEEVYINYILSNANTAIFLDALKVSKENAYPKVSYDIEVNILNHNLSRTLYRRLAQIIMINDVKLKFKNVYGYISSLELDLDNVQNDIIEVQNYKTKFEDIFTNIVAQTESMQRASGAIMGAAYGNVPLSYEGLLSTFDQNQIVLQAYLDSYFDTSKVVEDKLASLFNEAGEILSDSNKSLNSLRSLSMKNAAILSGFAASIQNELTPQVYRSANKPINYKVGDIWIDNQGNHYVATANSGEGGVNGTSGFVRTFDGTLAQINGAALDVNAADGTVNIKALNNISIASADVNIVGNRAVNIGGTTINIAGEASGVDVGGVNIVATKYDTANIADAYVAKVLIHPTEITMAGASIKMYTGTAQGAANSIQLDGANGIWIGSNKAITLYSGGFASSANVELNPTHILFGVSDTSSGSAAVTEITKKHMIFAIGTDLDDLQPDNAEISLSGSLSGVKITKDAIGLATGSGNTRSIIAMGEDGIKIGHGTNSETTGSYITLSGTGISFGSLANLYFNTNNFKLQTNVSANGLGNTILALGTNLQSVGADTTVTEFTNTSTVDFLVNQHGVFLRGYVYAQGGSFTGNIIATANNGKFIANGSSLGFYKVVNNTDTAVLTIDNNGTIEASGDLKINTGKSFYIGTNTSSNSVLINSDGITLASNKKLDINTSNVIIKSDASGSNIVFQLKNGNTSYLKYTADGKLDLTVNSLNIGAQSLANYISSSVNITPETIWAGVKTATASTSLTLTDSSISLKVNNTTAIALDSNGITMTGKNISMSGSHILINGKKEWSRDDIIVMRQTAPQDAPWQDSIAHITSYMSNGSVTIGNTTYTRPEGVAHDWVLIKPYYNAVVTAVSESGRLYDGSVMYYNWIDQAVWISLSNTGEATLGDGGDYYIYEVTAHIVPPKTTTGGGTNVSDGIAYLTNSSGTVTIEVPISGVPLGSEARWWTGSFRSEGASKINLCGEGQSLKIRFGTGSALSDIQVENITVVVSTDATNARVPCTVYYYP